MRTVKGETCPARRQRLAIPRSVEGRQHRFGQRRGIGDRRQQSVLLVDQNLVRTTVTVRGNDRATASQGFDQDGGQTFAPARKHEQRCARMAE